MTVPTATEQWRPIPGWEQYYEVSDLGRVRSLDRLITETSGRLRRWKGRVLKATLNGEGRRSVVLCDDGRRVQRLVHNLVLETFVGPRPDGLEGCHNDGDRTNNRLSNLRWDTHSNNQLDSVVHGTHNMARKKRCPRSHLLASPNLTRGARESGHRACLACQRAHSMVDYARRTGQPHDFVAWADDHYARIMTAA